MAHCSDLARLGVRLAVHPVASFHHPIPLPSQSPYWRSPSTSVAQPPCHWLCPLPFAFLLRNAARRRERGPRGDGAIWPGRAPQPLGRAMRGVVPDAHGRAGELACRSIRSCIGREFAPPIVAILALPASLLSPCRHLSELFSVPSPPVAPPLSPAAWRGQEQFGYVERKMREIQDTASPAIIQRFYDATPVRMSFGTLQDMGQWRRRGHLGGDGGWAQRHGSGAGSGVGSEYW